MMERRRERKDRSRFSRAGQIIERGARIYLVRVFLGRDPRTRKRRYLSRVVHGNKKDAQAVLNELLLKRDRGRLGLESREPLGQFLDYWLDNVKQHQVEARTLYLYRDYLKRYIRPGLDRVPLCELKVSHLQEVAAALRARKLSARTVQLAFAPLRDALDRAVSEQRIEFNPAKLVDLRGLRGQKKAAALDPDQVRAFIRVAEPDRHGACLVFLVATGMRPGELIALRWSDVDVDARLGRIERALTRVPKQAGWRVKTPKTAAGRRVIVLDETALRVLRQQRKWQAEDRLAVGAVWQDHDLVFATEIGTPLHVGNLGARHFKRLLGTAAIPTTFRLYDLRHTYGTRMIEQGNDAKTVAELMGHANVTLTLSTYTHPNLEMKRRAVARLEKSLSG